jgi:hypothetical protein
MLSKTRTLLARHKLYWLYMPLFWIAVAGTVLILTNGKAIVPFLYRGI